MLDSLLKLSGLLLSDIWALLPSITTAPSVSAGTARIAPQDPSTLALAIVGFITLALYVAATGWRKPRRDMHSLLRPPIRVETQQSSAIEAETPKRGAA